MPTLPKTQTADLTPSPISGGRRAGAEDFGAVDLTGATRRVAAAGDQILQGQEEDETRKVLVAQAEIRAKYAKRLDEAALSGEPIEPIKQEMENDQAKVTEGLSTRRGLETAHLGAANSGAVFDNAARTLEVQRAVTAARVDGQKFINGLVVQTASDPSSLRNNEQLVDDFASTLSRVPQGQRIKFAEEWKQSLNVAAVRSVIRVDPAAGKAAVESGKFNLTPEQVEQSLAYANTVESANRAAAAQERAQRQFERVEKDNVAEDKITRGILTGKLSGRALADEIANNPDLMPQTRRTLTAFAHTRANEMTGGARKSDQNVKFQLWSAIRNGEITSAAPILAAANNLNDGKPGINTTDADYLLRLVGDQRDENNRAIGPKIVSAASSFRRDLAGNMRVMAAAQQDSGLISAIAMEYQSQIEARISQIRAGGGNANDVFDPKSKDYVGTKEFRQAAVDAVMNQAGPQAVRDKVAAETMAFPDGTTRQYTGKGSKLDPNNWVVVKPGYGNRPDGTVKGAGYFGELRRPDGNVSTELSVQFDDVIGGQPFPLIVPTLTRKEINTVLALKDNERPPKAILDKAIAHAEKRVREGKSPFAGANERTKVPE